jgi:hypothetical protein
MHGYLCSLRRPGSQRSSTWPILVYRLKVNPAAANDDYIFRKIWAHLLYIRNLSRPNPGQYCDSKKAVPLQA